MVQFFKRFRLSFLLFLGIIMYDNNMIMSWKQKKRKFELRIKLNHNIIIQWLLPLYIIATGNDHVYNVAGQNHIQVKLF